MKKCKNVFHFLSYLRFNNLCSQRNYGLFSERKLIFEKLLCELLKKICFDELINVYVVIQFTPLLSTSNPWSPLLSLDPLSSTWGPWDLPIYAQTPQLTSDLQGGIRGSDNLPEIHHVNQFTIFNLFPGSISCTHNLKHFIRNI